MKVTVQTENLLQKISNTTFRLKVLKFNENPFVRKENL